MKHFIYVIEKLTNWRPISIVIYTTESLIYDCSSILFRGFCVTLKEFDN